MVRKTGHGVHIAVETPTSRAGLCGSTTGKGWLGQPNHVSWLYDKWCSRCWKLWVARTEGLWA